MSFMNKKFEIVTFKQFSQISAGARTLCNMKFLN